MPTTYRATRNEPRVGVGEWTGDFHINEIYTEVPAQYQLDDEGNPKLDANGDAILVYARIPNGVPDYICAYLMSHGLLIDSRVSLEPAESPAPPTGPIRPTNMAIVTPLDNEDDSNDG